MKRKYVSPFTDETILRYTNGDGTEGTSISKNYRIPALITLPDGTLLAAADARWDTYFDGGGLDTAVAYSTDQGQTWNTYLANYLGDHGNVWNPNSTTLIDPALMTDGDTIYLLVDLFPYALAMNGAIFWPIKETGFNKDGKLALKKGTRTIEAADFTYYLGDIDTVSGYAYIYDAYGNIVPEYKVDGKFNLFSADNDSYITNLFMENGIFEVMPVAYLYLTSSKDKGKTWSDPTLLNVKTTEELACLIGPGRGLVTSKGVMLFACYSYHRQQTALLYSVDHGKKWTRFQSLSDDLYWSGEATIVELDSGKIRCFFRNDTCCMCYVDIEMDENGIPISWGEPVKTEIRINSNTQLSAIKYSKKMDSCEVILVSCAAGKGTEGSDSCKVEDRTHGKVFVFFVNDKNKMYVKKSHDITADDEFFAYSCLTELSDGSIGLLYEKESTVIDFIVLGMEALLEEKK